MAKQTWNNPIDKNVDWGGDANTEGLPVSGAMIQKFIKESLDGKAGMFYYDTTNNRYLVFADSQTKDEYLADPTRTELILGTFNAPFNYGAEIILTTPAYNAVYLGSKGNYIDFLFDIKNNQGVSTGESAVVTYTIVRNSTKQVITTSAMPGANVRFNVDDYLGEGVNTVIIGITGQSTLAATTVAVTYNVVNLQISNDADITKVYDLTTGPKMLETGVTVKGAGVKTIEWYLDGVMLDFVKAEDEVVEIEGYRPKSIELANLQQGRHSLQVRAFVTVNGDKFYTPTLYRDIIVYTGVNTDTILAMQMEIPSKYGVVTEAPILYGITQYIPYTLKFASYSPTNREIVPVAIALDGEALGSVNSKNGILNEFSIISKNVGSKTLTLTAEDAAYEIPMVIDATSMAIEEITTGLKLDFTAVGMNDDSWSYGDYKGKFEGFNWNATSGWVNNRLRINAGASFAIDYAPLAGTPTDKGRTLEFEFRTTNVNDDNAVICDLRENGVGLLITATKISLTSEAGVVVENEFKANEEVRLSIVINKTSGSTRKGLSLIYANGCVSRCENWGAGDSYESNAQITFSGSLGAEVELKAIRIYEAALSDDQILNNYILYRDTVAEMLEVYDRNDIYMTGTTTFSPDKMMSRLPVMIVTGDIPTLENTSDKDTQIIVDIEYTNMQDTSRSFRMEGAAMRPQGTSSMGYPKKNFRIYTQKAAGTILYDANGNVVADKLYSFKKGAIPVDCWCLKADYAESSGTHNTGIARLWNKALYNMQVNGEYVCRTDAQKAALAAGYPYDVRTTIDGFPILLFYRRNASDEPIFIGKYNFNNDKSTEKVFGFKDVPGFDNSRMQCWEVLNNGNAIGLFTDISDFYKDVTEEGKTKKGWEFAFEGRYPDKSTNTTDLYNFAVWMNGVNGDAARFATEKWEHFKIYPMAAYYCYLMRHAAADQLVKNAMLTSEDGEKFYFILYDNDTINGLNNIGEIDILPTDDRNSVDASGQYKFAGHSSVLWNMLEGDAEFMSIVKEVDNALYSAGISYNECIRIFDAEQADKWVERVYNQDSEYKYVGPFVNAGINNLEMLQGKRDLHRRWWLSKRFSIYDAKFVSGEYKSQAVEMKCMNDTPAGQQFTVTAGYPLDYGYGINNAARETGITLAAGESHEFTTSEVVNLGDPIRIYGAPNIAELDLSKMANRLSVLSIANVYTEALGTRLEKLIVGGEGVNNAEVSEISGLKMAKKLTHLDVRGMRGIKSLDLTSQPYFENLKAIGSEVASVSFAKGAPVNRLELPATIKVLNLEQLPYLTAENLVFEDVAGLYTINVKNCPNLANSFGWIKNWYDSKATADAKCTLVMDGVNWDGVNADDLLNIAKVGNLDLKGKVVLTEVTAEQINALTEAFGDSAFNKDADFYIDAPAAVFVAGRTTITEGESEQYNVVVFGAEVKRVVWSIEVATGNSYYAKIDAASGNLTVTEGFGGGSISVKAAITTDKGVQINSVTVTVKAIIYPTYSDTSIYGKERLENDTETYELVITTETTGKYKATWTLSGLEDYAVIESQTDTSCVIRKLKETTSEISGTLNCRLTRQSTGGYILEKTKTIIMLSVDIAENDAGICAWIHSLGLSENEAYVTKDEAASITADMLGGISSTYKSKVKKFNGLKYFTSLGRIPHGFMSSATNLKEVELPDNITEIGTDAFRSTGIKYIRIPEGVHTIGEGAFAWADLEEVVLPTTLKEIMGYQSFKCLKLKSITLPEGLESIGNNAFESAGLTEIRLPSSLKTLEEMAFLSCSNLKRLEVMGNLFQIHNGCFAGCVNLSEMVFHSSIAPEFGHMSTSPFSPFGTANSTKYPFTGLNTYNTGENILYVPAGATGYDASYWLDPLQNPDKCGFTLSATL